MDASRPGPATSQERIAVIDALRGFALFGILLANIPYWGGLPFANAAQLAAIGGHVGLAPFVIFFNFVLDGKFYTLFSLLFGLGFALQLHRLEGRGADGLRIYRRRTLALLVIGLVHLCLIWDGDILTLYALMGLLLPIFRPMSDRALIGWGLGFIFALPLLGGVLRDFAGFEPGAPFAAAAAKVGLAFGVDWEHANVIDTLGRGGFAEWRSWTAQGPLYWIADRLENWRVSKVLGTMLIGMLAGRLLIRGQLLDNRRLLKRVMIGGFAIGLPASLVYTGLPPHSQNSLPSMIGTFPQGLAYGAAFLLAWPRAPFLRVLVPVGRMALTNYVTHSVLFGAMFFGIGFGLMGRVEVLWLYALALAVFAAQIALSRWWLATHRQGPLEALWRRMTYGRAGAMPAAA